MSDPVLTDPLLFTAGSHVAPHQRARNLRLGAWVLIAADVFIWAGLLFGFVYLRSLNSHGLWHPHGISPSTALGIVTAIAIVASAVAVRYALGALRDGSSGTWRAGAGIGLALLVVALVVQVVQLVNPGFSPSHAGGYGSIFLGYTATMVVHLLGAAYWLETIVASSGAFHRHGEDEVPSPLYEPAAAAYATFAVYLGAVAAVGFVMLYL
jgi:heme/copper-type cytochrome/quinol oxidase subunit 3